MVKAKVSRKTWKNCHDIYFEMIEKNYMARRQMAEGNKLRGMKIPSANWTLGCKAVKSRLP
jgi:hypothetical protein